MKLRFFALFCALALPAFLLGCGGGKSYDVLSNAANGDQGGPTQWTVLVYLNADNDLERYGILNVNQMEEVGSSSRVKIVVQMDRSPGYDSTNGDWKGTRRFVVTKDNDTTNITSPVIQDLGEVDMGDPNTLEDFIRWGQQNYPAEHYLLVLWNHGSGWRSAPIINTVPRNISYDDTSNTSIKTTDLPVALSAASPQFDVVAMDASLMQMLEVGYEMKDSAHYLVASEESPPGEGYEYSKWLSKLVANPSMSPADLSKVIVNEYVQNYVGSYSVTQSAIDLTKLDGVVQATDQLAQALQPLVSTKAAAIASARDTSQDYAYTYYKDLLDFSGRVSSLLGDANVTAANTALQQAMSSAIISEGHTGSSVAESHGISIYIPEPSIYLPRYTELKFAQDTHWDEFLDSMTQ